MTIHKRNQTSGGQATRRLYRLNGGLCADCGKRPRITRYRSSYCQLCVRRRAKVYNRQRRTPRPRKAFEGGHVINPKTDGFRCEKCGEPVARCELNSHWKGCVKNG